MPLALLGVEELEQTFDFGANPPASAISIEVTRKVGSNSYKQETLSASSYSSMLATAKGDTDYARYMAVVDQLAANARQNPNNDIDKFSLVVGNSSTYGVSVRAAPATTETATYLRHIKRPNGESSNFTIGTDLNKALADYNTFVDGVRSAVKNDPAGAQAGWGKGTITISLEKSTKSGTTTVKSTDISTQSSTTAQPGSTTSSRSPTSTGMPSVDAENRMAQNKRNQILMYALVVGGVGAAVGLGYWYWRK